MPEGDKASYCTQNLWPPALSPPDQPRPAQPDTHPGAVGAGGPHGPLQPQGSGTVRAYVPTTPGLMHGHLPPYTHTCSGQGTVTWGV